MTINKPHLCTRIQIWFPRYKDKHGVLAEPVALIAKYKAYHSTPIMIIEFTKAKHLIGQRFAIPVNKVLDCPLTTNGKIECFAVPMSALESYDTGKEVSAFAFSLFD